MHYITIVRKYILQREHIFFFFFECSNWDWSPMTSVLGTRDVRAPKKVQSQVGMGRNWAAASAPAPASAPAKESSDKEEVATGNDLWQLGARCCCKPIPFVGLFGHPLPVCRMWEPTQIASRFVECWIFGVFGVCVCVWVCVVSGICVCRGAS